MFRVFVYGALMYPAIQDSTAVAARVPDHKVKFVLKGLSKIEPAFAALIPEKGETAWGVLVSYTDKAWQKARKHEVIYKEVPIIAYSLNNEPIHCITLIINTEPLIEEVTPSARYSSQLYTAAKHFKFPDQVISRYYHLIEQGNKFTARFRYLTPLIKKALPRFGTKSFLFIAISLSCIIGALICIVKHFNFNVI